MTEFRNRLLVGILATVAALAGCTSAKTPAMEPEAVVTEVLADCRNGEYEAVARRFEGGVARWKDDPGWVRSYVDRLCTNGQAITFKVHERVPQGENDLALHLTTYKDAEQKSGLRTMTWWFEQQGKQWIVTRVE